MTDESLVPEWIMREKRDMEREENSRQEAARMDAEAKLTIERKAPIFWQSLKEKIHITIESLPIIGLNGSFKSSTPDHIHVEVSRVGNFPSVTNSDLHFDGNEVRCTGLNVGHYQIRILASTDGDIIAAIAGQSFKPLDADRAVEYIMKKMVDYVKRATIRTA
jgi:hypothetical protein